MKPRTRLAISSAAVSKAGSAPHSERESARSGHIPPVCLRFAQIKERSYFPQMTRRARLRLAHPGLPFGISPDVGAVVIKKVTLDVALAGLGQQRRIRRPRDQGSYFSGLGSLPTWRQACVASRDSRLCRIAVSFVRARFHPESAPRGPGKRRDLRCAATASCHDQQHSTRSG